MSGYSGGGVALKMRGGPVEQRTTMVSRMKVVFVAVGLLYCRDAGEVVMIE